MRADFHETQTEFLMVLLGAVLRRGIPRAILLDNHGSFTGSDVTVAAAKLGVRLVFARPHDGPSKGKIERWWRTRRARRSAERERRSDASGVGGVASAMANRGA